VSLEDIFNGITKQIKYKREKVCKSCNGTGAANESSRHKCVTCNGSGMVQKVANTIVGTVISQISCPDCGGSGEIIQTVCPVCNGRKMSYEDEIIEVNIPKSIKNGDVISIEGAGNASINGGPSGNLLVIIIEGSNEFFVRQESNLLTSQEISIYDAIFGKELELNTIENKKIKFNIPPGTQSGTRLRLEGKGMHRQESSLRGDMYLDIFVFIPKTLSKKEKEIFEKLKNSENIQPLKK
jgi:molecular chaperone DnaJ